jgi:hypothetical protein
MASEDICKVAEFVVAEYIIDNAIFSVKACSAWSFEATAFMDYMVELNPIICQSL